MPAKPGKTKIEPEYEAVYSQWAAQPTPKTMSALLTALRPAMQQGIHMVLKEKPSPYMMSMAKKITVDAIRSYDPRQAGLRTHVISYLRGLNRLTRQASQPLHMAERVAFDRARMHEVREELRSELGREPSDGEIADKMGVSVKRLVKLNAYAEPMAEGYFAGMQGDEKSYMVPSVVASSSSAEFARRSRWLEEAIYDDLDGRQQAVLEWSTGLHGQRPLSTSQIAKKLGVTPGMVSQIRNSIEEKLRKAEALFQ